MTIERLRKLVDEAPVFEMPNDDDEGNPEGAQKPPFSLVPLGDLDHVDPPAPVFAWEGLVPSGQVTLFSAHGGVGKTLVALMLATCVVTGAPLFGIPTRQGAAVFFSGEDGAALLRHRAQQVFRHMGVTAANMADRLHILDATEDDPTLFAEVTAAGRREGVTTRTYAGLRAYLRGKDVRLLVVDNASDAFDASEIDRAKVRGFMRALARIAREFDLAVLLLAHVDKGTSRGERSGTEGYSGSTAWNNSARSRLFMTRDKDGALLIEHQKHNLGPLHAPLRLIWPHGGLPQLEVAVGPVVQGIADRNHEKALLKLIAEYDRRGEHVSAATTSRTHAARLLSREPTYPRLKDGEVFDILRQAERAGRLERIQVKGANRHGKDVWHVTPAGAAFAGIPAPTAPTAPTSEVGAPNAPDAEGCADCADFALGGTGEMRARTEPPEPSADEEIPA